MGAAGFPLPNVELKLAADGELLVRGPSVFSGYWQKPEASAKCFDADGWFYTGDIAHFDADGFLFITDRKKELLKTSGGKMVAPQPIESKLKNSLFVAQAALYGEIVREANGSLANFETLKRFRVVAEEWTQESGELTPSMKLKRRVLTERYSGVIAELYEDEATSRGE